MIQNQCGFQGFKWGGSLWTYADKGELTKSDDRVVDQGRGYSCLESSSMLDIPLSTEEVDLDSLNIEVATTVLLVVFEISIIQ